MRQFYIGKVFLLERCFARRNQCLGKKWNKTCKIKDKTDGSAKRYKARLTLKHPFKNIGSNTFR